MRIGIIGAAGKIGQMRVETVRKEPRCELAAVMDLAADKAAAIAGGAPVFTELDRFLDQKMDAVVISTPSHVREPLCIAAFQRGLHVLSEKPLAQNLASARRIVDAARTARRHLGGGFNMRYYPAFAFVKDIVASGRIGEIDHVRIYGGHGGLANFTHDWEYKAEFSGGGALWDVGIHMTDMARHILGEITEIYGVSSNRVWNLPGSEDNAMAIMKNPDGVAAIYQATWNGWKGYQSAIEVYGTRGMVSGAYAPMHNLLITQDKPGGRQTRTVKRYFDVALREKLKSWKVTAVDAFQGELADFIALTEGREGLRIADGHAALRAIEIATLLPESSGTAQPVTLENLGPMRV